MVSIEDPFDQDDWDGYRPFTAAIGEKAWDFRTLESNKANKKQRHLRRCRSLGMTY